MTTNGSDSTHQAPVDRARVGSLAASYPLTWLAIALSGVGVAAATASRR